MRPTRISSIRRLVLLAALLPLAACATKGDLRNVTLELRALSARQDSLLMALERQALVTQDSLRGTSNQLLEVRGTVNQQLARIQQELGMLRQENAQFAQLLASIRDQLERVSRMGSATVQVPPPAGGGATDATPPGNSGAIELFQSAFDQYTLGNYATARRNFQRVIEQFPNDTEVASESQFKLGEILVAEQKPDEAILAFKRVRQLWPTSRKVPDAMLQVAVVNADLQRWPDARLAFQFVIDNYPNTQAAETAQERIRALPPGQ